MDIIQIRVAVTFVRVFWDLIFVFLLWFRAKSKATFHLGWSVLFFGIYAAISGLLEYVKTDRLFLARLQWIAVLALPASLAFVAYFIDRTKHIRLKIFLWYLPAIAIVVLALTTDYFVIAVSDGNPYIYTIGVLDPFARAGFVIMGVIGFCWFLMGYRKSQGIKRQQIKHLLAIAAASVTERIVILGVLPSITGVGLIYFYDIADDIFSFALIFLAIYIIVFREIVFEIKAILTEALVGVIGLILLVQAFLSQSTASKVFGFITFFFFLFAGYLLIKTTRKEIQRKEEVEKLAKELEGFNRALEGKIKERTKDLEKSYQEIKASKDELEDFYNLAVGRELKMAELKKEIGKLKK